MLKYCEWIKLHESLGSVTLGMGKNQNMGLHGRNNNEVPEEDMDNDDLGDTDEENPEDSENPDEDSGEEDVDDQIGDEDTDKDTEDDDEDGMPKKKAPMGDYHDDSPFMKKESCEDSEEDDDEETDNHDKDSQDDKSLAFMQKKGMKSGKKKIKKKCSADMEGEVKMCSKCKGMKSEKVKKESVSEEDDFLNSLQKSHNVGGFKTYSSGMNEDMLILPPESIEMSFGAKPGDVGYAPDTRLGLAESFGELLKKVENLEKKLKS